MNICTNPKCLKEFIPNIHTPYQKFCSSKCREKYSFIHNRIKINAQRNKRYKNRSKEEIIKIQTKRQNLKLKVLSYYAPDLKCHGVNGNGCPSKCEDIRCLTIDHINGKGEQHRKIVGSGTKFYQWLKNNNFPEGYQVLCFNCNCGIKRYENKESYN
jgi:hypothetical protein